MRVALPAVVWKNSKTHYCYYYRLIYTYILGSKNYYKSTTMHGLLSRVPRSANQQPEISAFEISGRSNLKLEMKFRTSGEGLFSNFERK